MRPFLWQCPNVCYDPVSPTLLSLGLGAATAGASLLAPKPETPKPPPVPEPVRLPDPDDPKARIERAEADRKRSMTGRAGTSLAGPEGAGAASFTNTNNILGQ